jgi:general secretion pathway protein J
MSLAKGDTGFTLLEILVVLVVFGILMLGITRGTQFGMAAWNRQTAMIAAATDIDSADRALRRLIEQMDPGTAQAPSVVTGAADRMVFTSNLPFSSAVATRRADMMLRFEKSRLILRWTSHRHARPVGAAPPPREEVLLTDLEGLTISYWPRPPGTGWQSAWNAPVLPELVRIHLALKDRRWPDIIAAPAAAPVTIGSP